MTISRRLSRGIDTPSVPTICVVPQTNGTLQSSECQIPCVSTSMVKRNPGLRSRTVARLLALLMALGHTCELLAAGHAGQVLLAGRAVPGATVTVSQGDKKFVTSTDAQGTYQLPDLPDGTWT